jgi:hypothetical protein
MWHIVATICFINLTAMDMACFPNAYFPQKYNTEEQCMEVAKSMASLLDEDFQRLQVRGSFSCINKRPLVLPPTSPEKLTES